MGNGKSERKDLLVRKFAEISSSGCSFLLSESYTCESVSKNSFYLMKWFCGYIRSIHEYILQVSDTES